jgi:hypothetical protein
MICREEARLRSLFRRLLLVSAAAGSAACSSPSTTTTSPDASLPPDGAAPPPVVEASTVDAGGGVDAPLGDDGGTVDATVTPDSSSDDGGSIPDGSAEDVAFIDGACAPQFIDGMDDGTGCNFFEHLGCGLPPGTMVEACHVLLATCQQLCRQSAPHPCDVVECVNLDAGPEAAVPSGPLTLECTTGNSGCAIGPGRRPEGLLDMPPTRGGDAVATWLADAARLEGASVHAFRRLARELAARRAPRALVRAAERSARDEVRHARVTARLARRRGAVPAPVTIQSVPPARSAEAFAIENAVEGCVRECFAALLATHQATHARDRELASEMTKIARDETRHAALAMAVARWILPRLDPGARDRVARAKREALSALREEVSVVSTDVASELGLPTGDDARALVDAFAASLFAAERAEASSPTATA